MNTLSQEKLKELIEYDESTGRLTWKITVSPRGVAGTDVGHIDRGGYRRCRLYGKPYPLTRLIWLYMTGEMPSDIVDHINGVPSDNRWCNLRIANVTQNNQNKHRSARNSSGYKGVYFDNRSRKWRAEIVVSKKRIRLGRFSNVEDAARAYRVAALEMFGEFAYIGELQPKN